MIFGNTEYKNKNGEWEKEEDDDSKEERRRVNSIKPNDY